MDFSLFQVYSVVVGGCSLQKLLFVEGPCLLLYVVVRCFGCIVVFTCIRLLSIFRLIYMVFVFFEGDSVVASGLKWF